jgi:hypothetical protein
LSAAAAALPVEDIATLNVVPSARPQGAPKQKLEAEFGQLWGSKPATGKKFKLLGKK